MVRRSPPSFPGLVGVVTQTSPFTIHDLDSMRNAYFSWRGIIVYNEVVGGFAKNMMISVSLEERRVASWTRTRVYAAKYKISQGTSDQMFTRHRAYGLCSQPGLQGLGNAFISLYVATVPLRTPMHDKGNIYWLELRTTEVPVLANHVLVIQDIQPATPSPAV